MCFINGDTESLDGQHPQRILYVRPVAEVPCPAIRETIGI